MSRRTVFLVLLVALVGGALFSDYSREVAPTPEKIAKIDLVRSIQPVSTALAGIRETVDDMATMTQSEREDYLERYWPHLAQDVTYYLRRHGKINPGSDVTRVEYRYGTREGVSAESGDGQRHQGYFQNQLLAVVHISNSEPIVVLVECLNGTFMLPGEVDTLEAVGESRPTERFTIGRGEGLIHYVDFPLAIDLAEEHGLALFKGRGMNEESRLTVAEARQLENQTDLVQVTVHVVEGDVFDLRQGTFAPSPRRAPIN